MAAPGGRPPVAGPLLPSPRRARARDRTRLRSAASTPSSPAPAPRPRSAGARRRFPGRSSRGRGRASGPRRRQSRAMDVRRRAAPHAGPRSGCGSRRPRRELTARRSSPRAASPSTARAWSRRSRHRPSRPRRGRCPPAGAPRRRPARRSDGSRPHDPGRDWRSAAGRSFAAEATNKGARDMDEKYPLTYAVDYPDRELNRLTTFFRIFTIIPIAILLGTVAHASYGGWNNHGTTYAAPEGCCSRAAADDPVPEEVPALVVRLEPRAAALLEPSRRLSRAAHGRPIPVDRRAAGACTSRSTTRTSQRDLDRGCHW